MLKISLLGEWLIWIMVGYLSSPRRIISFIIDATLRKGSEKVFFSFGVRIFLEWQSVLDLFLEAQEEGSSMVKER